MNSMKHTSIGKLPLSVVLMLLALLLTGVACEELEIVLEYKTALFVRGFPKYRPLAPGYDFKPADLTNKNWRRVHAFGELPEQFAVHTENKERVQILLQDKGVLDVFPESLVLVQGTELSNVRVLAGKCTFMQILPRWKDHYKRVSGDRKALRALIRKLTDRYIEKKQGMFYVKNPFQIQTHFSSGVARKGATLAIMIDSNRKLEFSEFSLPKLKPSFVRLGNAADAKYRYMAVTGLDIYEKGSRYVFSAAARDREGHWVKVSKDIATASFRRSVLKGSRLKPALDPEGRQLRFRTRYREYIRKKSQDKKFRKAYRQRLRRQNKRIAFYWKYKRVFAQKKGLQRSRRIFHKLFKQLTLEKHWQGKFLVPSQGVVTSGFGKYRHYFGGHASVHKGIDIAAPVGTDILAPNKGKILFAGFTPAKGNNILIDHGMGVFTALFHLSRIYVKKGETVEKGDVIAAMGNSGLSSGPHLHWEMVINGRRVNPLDWVTYGF